MFYSKQILLYFSLFTFHFSFSQPVISFHKTTHHLGFVRQGDTLKFQYDFTNTGDKPLIISDNKVQCSCTTVDSSVEPILPGKQGVIKITFKTNDAIDRQDRTDTVISNAKNSPVILRFKCIVLKAKNK